MSNEVFKLCLLDKSNTIKETHLFDNSSGETFIYKDDFIENIKFKLVTNLNDKNSNHYLFFYKREYLFKHDIKMLFKKLSNEQHYISQRNAGIFFKNLKY